VLVTAGTAKVTRACRDDGGGRSPGGADADADERGSQHAEEVRTGDGQPAGHRRSGCTATAAGQGPRRPRARVRVRRRRRRVGGGRAAGAAGVGEAEQPERDAQTLIGALIGALTVLPDRTEAMPALPLPPAGSPAKVAELAPPTQPASAKPSCSPDPRRGFPGPGVNAPFGRPSLTSA
jgi:hypothetical protein